MDHDFICETLLATSWGPAEMAHIRWGLRPSVNNNVVVDNNAVDNNDYKDDDIFYYVLLNIFHILN